MLFDKAGHFGDRQFHGVRRVKLHPSSKNILALNEPGSCAPYDIELYTVLFCQIEVSRAQQLQLLRRHFRFRKTWWTTNTCVSGFSILA